MGSNYYNCLEFELYPSVLSYIKFLMSRCILIYGYTRGPSACLVGYT